MTRRECSLVKAIEHFPVEDDGCAQVPQAMGLGVTLNEETIERYRFVQ